MARLEQVMRYRRGREDHPLPSWVQYLIALGRFGVEHRVFGRRLVVAVSLPTHAYPAAFTALGVADAAYEDPEKRDARAHFEHLASLLPGTAIRFRRGRYLYCARLLGAEVFDGVECLTYQDQSKCYLPWDRCGDVAALDPTERFVRRRLLAPNAGFVEAVLQVDPLAHAADTRLDCLVVGIKESLRSEVVEQQFFAITDGRPPEAGVLNDLLRCDAFELNANDHDRTTVVSAFAEEIPERLERRGAARCRLRRCVCLPAIAKPLET